MLVTEGCPANPRGIFLLDMVKYVLAAQNKGHSIILGLDANESWERKTSGIRMLAEKCGLVNVHAELSSQQQWASHHKKGHSPIDFFLASPDIISCITKVGVLGFDDIFDSDHRPFFLTLMGQSSSVDYLWTLHIVKHAPSPLRIQRL